MKIKIFVTEKDIMSGTPKDHCRCPVARALERRVKSGWRVWIGAESAVIISPRENRYEAKFRGGIRSFIRRFDRNLRALCKPFSVTLKFSR